MRDLLGVAGLLLAAVFVLIGGTLLAWYWRDNESQVNPLLAADVWPVVSDGLHNSNTDLILWDDQFYLVHAQSPYHMGTTESRLIVRRSSDGRQWEQVAELQVPGEDIRDPKFAIINDSLFLYALPNSNLEPEPFGTVVSTSQDGVNWTSFEDVEPQGWLFWRPKTLDGETWYVTAYWHEHGKSALLKSKDGLNWEFISEIHQGDRNDETAFEFLPDGRMLITARLEGDDRAFHQGSMNAGTLIGVAEPPYTDWKKTVSKVSRLDGPVLFTHNDEVYAAGRYDPEGYEKWYGNSSLLGRKRTALYRLTEDGMVHLTDLPSAGDTSYVGAVQKDDDLYLTYYTSDTGRDVPWVMGLFMPSDILMARIPLENLERIAGEQP